MARHHVCAELSMPTPPNTSRPHSSPATPRDPPLESTVPLCREVSIPSSHSATASIRKILPSLRPIACALPRTPLAHGWRHCDRVHYAGRQLIACHWPLAPWPHSTGLSRAATTIPIGSGRALPLLVAGTGPRGDVHCRVPYRWWRPVDRSDGRTRTARQHEAPCCELNGHKLAQPLEQTVHSALLG